MIRVPDTKPLADAHRYRRHRPEATLLYHIVEQHYPEFAELMRRKDWQLPAFVHRSSSISSSAAGTNSGF